ncbi:GGDEF domain-containing protein [Microbulbifer epialgicus]|uniref:diguanylate cyclase n=1 Tax=Microbulbifer epialgicus TaxID=393907 RepID=A0ABV4NZP9_9GAMM
MLPLAQYLPWFDLTPLYNAQLPFLLLGAALLLSFFYRSSWVALAALLLLVFLGIDRLGLLIGREQDLPLYMGLIAINLMLFICCRDRSVLSFFGMAWLLALTSQGVGLLGLQEYYGALSQKFSLPHLPDWLPVYAGASPPLPLMMCMAASFGAFLLLGLYPGPTAMGLFSCTVLVLYGVWSELPMVVLASTAGFLLIASLLGTSYELAFRDELTGVRSRRAFRYQMLTPSRHYCIAMIDIDYFKKLNDRFGHQVGDQVLRMVASQIARCSRGSVFRYGGEEFALVIPGRDRAAAERELESMREKIATYPMRLRSAGRVGDRRVLGLKFRSGQLIKVTVSIGLAQRGKQLKKPESVLKAADQALYKAKRNGRNCLCVHS